MIALAMSFMSGIHAGLTLRALAFIPVIILYSLFFHRRIGRSFLAADEEEGKLSSIAQENLTGVRVVRTFGRERYEREHFGAQNARYTAAYMRFSVLISIFWTVGDVISGLQVMTVVVLGAVLAVRGQLSAGSYIAFISYNAMLVWPVRQLGRVLSDMSKAGVSVDRIRYIMNAKREQDPPHALEPPIDRDICFEHVSFRYTGDTPEVLRDISFTIPQGSSFGILGGTGSGKSTITYLLERMYEPSGGQITIGGMDIADIRREWLRRHTGLVLQEPYLFSRTLGENIKIARNSATPDEVRYAARIADLESTISRFGSGYDTPVGERGELLSTGEKQLLSYARAVLADPAILILDEATSSIDTVTEQKIQNSIERLIAGRTAFMIAHRLSTIVNADLILTVADGRIIESGTHRALMQKRGAYYRLFTMQYEKDALNAI